MIFLNLFKYMNFNNSSYMNNFPFMNSFNFTMPFLDFTPQNYSNLSNSIFYFQNKPTLPFENFQFFNNTPISFSYMPQNNALANFTSGLTFPIPNFYTNLNKAQVDLDTKTTSTKQSAKTSSSNSSSKVNSSSKTDSSSLFTNSKIQVTEVNNGAMPYLIIAPKDVKPNEKLPLLVHLHGQGQVGGTLKGLQVKEFDMSRIMNEWKLKNFRGYIICPLLRSGSWNKSSNADKIRNIYNDFKSTHNVDTNKVAVSGASLGAQGALYMANELSDIFKKAAAFSPYNPGNLGSGMKIPTKVFCGAREGGAPKSLVTGKLKTFHGVEGSTVLNGVGHDGCTRAALSVDKNNDGYSDLIQWLFA